jgi:hypothetical protein
MDVVDLELGLHRREAEAYEFEIRFSTPESDAETWIAARVPVGINDLKAVGQPKFDIEVLGQTKYDVDDYGRKLFKYLFADTEVTKAFAKARAIADERKASLRVRLLVGSTAPELHSLFWESIRDPSDGSPLFTGERVLFSRYLSSADWRPVRRRPKANLRALVVVANPSDLAKYKLAALDVPTEMARAKSGLEGIARAELPSGGTATLDRVMRGLQDGYDILYLMCHGALVQDERDQIPRAWLWLEDETAKSHKVLATELIQRVRELRNPPALIVLASCQSAGAGSEARTSDAGVLASIGPGLAEAGVPAILAMQGDVTIATVAKFMPVFFRELQRDGQIDRAAAAARGAVRDRDDWYVPVLFMRLKGGCLWYAPGFEADAGLENWDAVIQHIGASRWTPIIGPGLYDALLGSRREIARRWADTFHFPMAPYNREDLPQVAQYLAIKQRASTFPQNELIQYLGKELSAYFSDKLSEELRQFKPDEPFPVKYVSRLISFLGSQQRKDNPAEPFRVLAGLPLPIYVTAAPNNLMADALRDAKKEPRVEFCRWNDDLLELPGIYGKHATEPEFRPSVQQPLVYHLFGHLDFPESIVMTEDDYFDFLIGMMKNVEFIPDVVKRTFTDTGLVFLGFQLEDWNFRVMFRAIMSRPKFRRKRYAHVAAQIYPEEGRLIEPSGARKYLESYFTDVNISIYWGSAEDFARDLLTHWGNRNQ